MATTGIKKFNWVNRPSRWEVAQAWRSHRSKMVQQFLSDAETASAAFTTAQNNLTTGMATLAAQASIQLAQAKIEAAKNKILSANAVDLLA